jgi:hypothetical protein
MKRIFAAAIVVFGVGSVCPVFVHAEGECKADLQKFCSDVQPGQGRMIDCLKAHVPDLSPNCQTKLKVTKEKIQAKIKAAEAACGDDEKKFCGDVKPGEGRIKECMTQHASELSGACQAVVIPNKTSN